MRINGVVAQCGHFPFSLRTPQPKSNGSDITPIKPSLVDMLWLSGQKHENAFRPYSVENRINARERKRVREGERRREGKQVSFQYQLTF
eukprot:TRINITY_DN4678_c2_g1_i1.p1 TRINITY_DN4678_c2_g1~~TRINITY_DN4678_c2_g1_i1.p1  ORF type:complete len:102 (-),score=15.19 TRINITY_DN4678_c2_g1_i1:162-428(-)